MQGVREDGAEGICMGVGDSGESYLPSSCIEYNVIILYRIAGSMPCCNSLPHIKSNGH